MSLKPASCTCAILMEAIDSNDVLAIQGLRKHRNELAHDLPDNLRKLDVDSYTPLLKLIAPCFKLSNYRTYMEIGHDPEFRDKGINWGTTARST